MVFGEHGGKGGINRLSVRSRSQIGVRPGLREITTPPFTRSP